VSVRGSATWPLAGDGDLAVGEDPGHVLQGQAVLADFTDMVQPSGFV
jgi:hypothetical protein